LPLCGLFHSHSIKFGGAKKAAPPLLAVLRYFLLSQITNYQHFAILFPPKTPCGFRIFSCGFGVVLTIIRLISELKGFFVRL
jgi:hypothetical protein